MTAATVPAPTAAPPRPSAVVRLGRLLAAIAHLVILGVVGPVVVSVLFGVAGAGIGLVFALGIGLVVLAGLVYVLWGIAWVENARVDGLYDLRLPALRLRRRTVPGFRGVVLLWWRQATDATMWRAVASAAVATILGVVALGLLNVVVAATALVVTPMTGASSDLDLFGWAVPLTAAGVPVLAAVAVVLGLAGIVGLALLHGVLAPAIVARTRVADLEEEVRVSDSRRAGAIRASEVERTRIERDLHDGVQPRLVSVGMTLGLARQKLDTDPEAAKSLVDEAHASTKAAITELRQLARGIHASVLDDRGLDAALSALAARSHVPVQLDVRLDRRCSRTAETAVYFAIAESLTNAAKHSRAVGVRVVVRRRDTDAGPILWARVEDDGIGGARVVPGGGLDGIVNRIVAAGGESRLDSPTGGPTALEVSVPCAS